MRRFIVFLFFISSFLTVAQAQYSGGLGTVGSPYQLSTAADIFNLMNTDTDWDKHFILMNDINVSGINLSPIGFETGFDGIFNGNSFRIFSSPSTNTINMTSDDEIGFFGWITEDGEVYDLGIEGINVVGTDYVGAFCGYNEGTINNCYSTGTVNGEDYVGGFCGYNEVGATIENSYSTGNVSSSGYSAYIGGFCGDNESSISNCYSVGNVTATADYSFAGGFCGYNEDFISNCCSYGNVTTSGDDSEGGGFVSQHYGAIEYCQAFGNVTSTGSDATAGGFVAYHDEGDIEFCCSEGQLSADVVGGFCAWDEDGAYYCCYYNSTNAGTTNDEGFYSLNLDGVDYFNAADWLVEGNFTSCLFTGSSADYWEMTATGPRLTLCLSGPPRPGIVVPILPDWAILPFFLLIALLSSIFIIRRFK